MAPSDAGELQRRVDDAREVFVGLQTAVRADYEAKDGYQLVSLGINAETRFSHCRVSSGWKGRGGVAALEKALIEAWASLDRQLDEAVALEIARRQGAIESRKAFVRAGAEAKARPVRNFTAPAAQQVYGVVDEVLSAVSNARQLAAAGTPPDTPAGEGEVITVTDPSGKVTARLENLILTSLTIDEEWADRTSPIVIGDVLCALFNAGRDEWAVRAKNAEPGVWAKAEERIHRASQRAEGVLQRSGLL